MFAAFLAQIASTDFATQALTYFASVWSWPG